MSGQRQLWVGQQLAPESSAFNAGSFTEIKGALDVQMFQQAAAACIAETECLRLKVLADAHGPYQVVASQAAIAMQFIDLTNEPDGWNAALAWMQTEIKKKLRLDQGKTFSWGLLQLTPEHFIFCSIYHHVVIDGMGSLLLGRRIRDFYEAFKTGTAARPVHPAPMVSLVNAEEAYRLSDRFAADRDYWMDQLNDRPDLLSLSLRGKNKPISWESHRESTWLSADAVDSLQQLADGLKTTLPRALMGAVTMAVNRLTGSSDFVLGMVVSGRGGRFRSISANLTNILPLRFQLSREMCLRDCIELAARLMEEANAHKAYQPGDIRNDLGLRPNHPGVVGIEVNIMPSFFFNDQKSGLGFTVHGLSPGPVEDLCISLCERTDDGRLRIDFNGNTDRYDKAELAQLASDFRTMLTTVATAVPEQRVSTTTAIEGEVHRAASGAAKPALESIAAPLESIAPSLKSIAPRLQRLIPEPLSDLFEAQVDRTPQAIALSFKDEATTFESLETEANRVARALMMRGVGTEDVIALLLPRGTELVVTMLAIVKAGAAYLPLDIDHPAARLLFMLQDSGARVVVTTREMRERLPFLSAFSLLLIDDVQQQQEIRSMSARRVVDAERVRPLQVDNLLYVIYTSGSTGEPKGVAIEHRSFSLQMKKMVRLIPMRSDETMLGITTVTFDPAGFEVFLPLLQGASLTLFDTQDSRDPVCVASSVAALGACVLQATPTFWRALFSCGVPRTVRAFVGGEALPADLVPQFLEFPEATNLYGPTETTVDSSFHRIVAEDAARSLVVSIGKPLEDEQFHILDENLDPVADGAMGELYISGSGLARGYINRPALNRDCFVNCPFGEPGTHTPGSRMYKTGDLARWRANGEVDYLGRADHQVKIRGIRIEPGEVESVLLRCFPEVAECTVVAREHRGEIRLVAYYTNAAGLAAPAQEQMRALLKERLPAAMVPSAFVRLDMMPRTDSAKLDRKALPDPGWEVNAGRFVPPANAEEATICAIFRDLTGAERVSRDDDFFALGGHSLAAVLCVNRLQRELASDVTLRQLFEAPTPERLARSMAGNEKNAGSLPGPASSGATLFLLPGVCGDEPRLVRFRLQCEASIKIVLLTYPDWQSMTDPATAAELLVRHLVQQILAVAGDDSIRLLGYSFGGYCSHAVAMELSHLGREVEFVGLLDASVLAELPVMLSTQLQEAVSPVRAGWFLLQDMGRLLRAVAQRQLGRVSALIAVRWFNWPPCKSLLLLVAKGRHGSSSSSFHYYLNHYFQESTRVAAMKCWYQWVGQEPVKLAAPAVLFRSEDHAPDEPQDLGWRRYFHLVSTINLAGDHHTMLDPPHLAKLIEETCRLLEREPAKA